jgi:hypothetical protein
LTTQSSLHQGHIGETSGSATLLLDFRLERPSSVLASLEPLGAFTDRFITAALQTADGRRISLGDDGRAVGTDIANTPGDESRGRLPPGDYRVVISTSKWQEAPFALRLTTFAVEAPRLALTGSGHLGQQLSVLHPEVVLLGRGGLRASLQPTVSLACTLTGSGGHRAGLQAGPSSETPPESEGVFVGPTPPLTPFLGQPWVDTSGGVPVLRLLEADESWGVASFQPNQSIITNPGTSPPAVAALGKLWLDTSSTPTELKAFDGEVWRASPAATAAAAAVAASAAADVAAAAATSATAAATAAEATATSAAADAAAAQAAASQAAFTSEVRYVARTTAPAGWLKANGAAISRATYANLFAAIGTSFGPGDGETTFNLPDLRGTFIRGFDDGRGVDPGRPYGSTQSGANLSHTHGVFDFGHAHGVSDPGHNHGVSDPGHAHGVFDPGHNHGVSDPGHAHGYLRPDGGAPANVGFQFTSGALFGDATSRSGTGISINGAGTGIRINGAGTGIGISGAGTRIGIFGAGTGVSIQANGTESRPVNVALLAIIKF